MNIDTDAVETRAEEVCRTLCSSIGARPVGTTANNEASSYLLSLAKQWNYDITSLPFACQEWRYEPSTLHRTPIHPGPFSPPLQGRFEVTVVERLTDLRKKQFSNRLLLIRGAAAAEPLMPKDFPFYYPEEHKEIIELLQAKRPAGIVALTGQHPLCGLNPFPLFEDGNLGIPNAYATEEAEPIPAQVEIDLRSQSHSSSGSQLVFTRRGASHKRVVLCAHMDTKYDTPGALDNASGVAVLMAVMEQLKDAPLPFTVEFVPFNGEEYYGVPGQLSYLGVQGAGEQPPHLVINIDGIGHRDSRNAITLYNFEEATTARARELVEADESAEMGEPWIAGDHSMFAFQGIPCVAVTSSNLMETVVGLTHTPADTIENLNFRLLDSAVGFIMKLLQGM